MELHKAGHDMSQQSKWSINVLLDSHINITPNIDICSDISAGHIGIF